MRVWDCDPRLLADKHLRAQHAEIHFAIRVIENDWHTKWKDVERFRRHPEGVAWLGFIHELTVGEMLGRGIVKDNWTPINRMITAPLQWLGRLSYLDALLAVGYPRTELNQGTPWERDGVSFEWYQDHHKDWTRQLAREASRA